MKLLRTSLEVFLDWDIPELRKLTRRRAKRIDRALAWVLAYVTVPVRGPSKEDTLAMLDADAALADLEATMLFVEREERADREWAESYIAALERVLASFPSELSLSEAL